MSVHMSNDLWFYTSPFSECKVHNVICFFVAVVVVVVVVVFCVCV